MTCKIFFCALRRMLGFCEWLVFKPLRPAGPEEKIVAAMGVKMVVKMKPGRRRLLGDAGRVSQPFQWVARSRGHSVRRQKVLSKE
jgi:hypothetical protein